LKVDAATRTITPFAGTGSRGFAGDGGAATAATMNLSPNSGIAVDTAGNVLFTDSNNNRVRRIDRASGIISTIAGTGSSSDSGDNQPAVSAGVRAPQGVVVSAAGNIYIAEFAGVIRRIDAAGVITTLTSSLKDPIGMAIDVDGNLLIADGILNELEKLDLTTKSLSTIAGDGVNRFAGDLGPPISASLNFPNSVAVTSSGAIYITDANNQRVRLIVALRHRSVRR
jgi:hypothetical protein